MKYALRFLPEVEADAIDGYEWYESKAVGLGEDFLRMFYVSASVISANPLLYPILHRDYRRSLLRRFPYALYFRIENRVVIVIGLFHCARNPRSIKTALTGRSEHQT